MHVCFNCGVSGAKITVYRKKNVITRPLAVRNMTKKYNKVFEVTFFKHPTDTAS